MEGETDAERERERIGQERKDSQKRGR